MSRLPGNRDDSEVKRLYLARLRRAQMRYDAAMKRPRRRLLDRKKEAEKLARDGHEAQATDLVKLALVRFERARQRSDRNRDRIRRRAKRWLERQHLPHAFRKALTSLSAAAASEVRP